ncbi:glycosyltransferase [Curtobacterium ammoniigenes]|uniref:glycosyltransferase n=1 Tax=Curtobacterium ammoniigenes TaxID=395387 RepID=UPI001470462E|nr:glycosyltransferase [Curtobacterium ammoniigenes]
MASIDPEKGGPSTAARAMAIELARNGHRVTVTAHDDGKLRRRSEAVEHGVRFIRFPLTSFRLQYSRAYNSWIKANAKNFDFVLINSLFLSHTTAVSKACRMAGVPYALRPHGSLNRSDMNRHLVRKRLYLASLGRKALKHAKFIFCTSEQEAQQAKSYGSVKVIPLGVSLPSKLSDASKEITASFIGRLAEKKGPEIFLEAIKQVAAERETSTFVIAGPDDSGFRKRYGDDIDALQGSGHLRVLEYVTPDERDELLARSSMFVLPSRDENFGIAVAESLALGTPVVITEGVSHADAVRRANAGLVIARTPTHLAEAIRTLMDLPLTSYTRMSIAAYDLARANYSWERSVRLLIDAIEQTA